MHPRKQTSSLPTAFSFLKYLLITNSKSIGNMITGLDRMRSICLVVNTAPLVTIQAVCNYDGFCRAAEVTKGNQISSCSVLLCEQPSAGMRQSVTSTPLC